MTAPLWQILVCSVASRTPQLRELLDTLEPQLVRHMGRVRVLVDRDNGERGVGPKRTGLVEAATATYTNFVDDDDQVSGDYVDQIVAALRSDPDYVGHKLAVSLNGRRTKDAIHSLDYPDWSEDADGYYRNVSHINPIRREAALAGLPFLDGFGEDRAWSEKVLASGLVRSQVFIPARLYHYRWSQAGSLFAGGTKTGEWSEHPIYPWVEYVTHDPCDRVNAEADDLGNELLKLQDALRYGVVFTDVTGRRIDPREIR